MAFASLNALVKHFESGGDYTAQNPTSTASGAYQFTNATWQTYAGQIGVDTRSYPTAASAPASVQDAVFNQAVSQRGLGDWTCPGCNPKLSAYLQANPQDAFLSTESGATAPGGGTAAAQAAGPGLYSGYGPNGEFTGQTTDPGQFPLDNTHHYVFEPATGTPQSGSGGTSAAQAGQPGYLPPAATGGPMALGITPGLASGIGGWINGIESAVGDAFKKAMASIFGTAANYLLRGVLIILALLLIAIALWRILDPDGEKAKAVVRSAAEAA